MPHSKGETRHLWTGSSVVLAEVPGTWEALSVCGSHPHSSPQALAPTLLPSNSSTMWYQRSLSFLGSRTTEGAPGQVEKQRPQETPELGLNLASWSICQAPNPVSTYSPGLITTSSPREQASGSPCESNEIFKWKKGRFIG